MLEIQKNNPLHGVKLEALLTELVEYYNWDVLADELNLNCFKQNPSIKSSLKFLRKTPWAREKVEGFYLYKYKRLPKPSDKEYELPPRDRTIPLSQKPGSPAELGRKQFDEAEEKKEKQENQESNSAWAKSDSSSSNTDAPVSKEPSTKEPSEKEPSTESSRSEASKPRERGERKMSKQSPQQTPWGESKPDTKTNNKKKTNAKRESSGKSNKPDPWANWRK